ASRWNPWWPSSSAIPTGIMADPAALQEDSRQRPEPPTRPGSTNRLTRQRTLTWPVDRPAKLTCSKHDAPRAFLHSVRARQGRRTGHRNRVRGERDGPARTAAGRCAGPNRTDSRLSPGTGLAPSLSRRAVPARTAETRRRGTQVMTSEDLRPDDGNNDH